MIIIIKRIAAVHHWSLINLTNCQTVLHRVASHCNDDDDDGGGGGDKDDDVKAVREAIVRQIKDVL